MPHLILTCNPDSDDLALAELRKVAPQARLAAELASGVLLIDCSVPFDALAAVWRAHPPIFIRHICPANTAIALLPQAHETLKALHSAVEILLIEGADKFVRGQPFSVQTRILADFPLKPFDVNSALAGAIEARTGGALDVRHPQQVVSVVIAALEGGHTAYLGLSTAANNLSDWAGGVRRFAREDGQISRSEFKLLEALEVFRIGPEELPPRGIALDLGAAPGGWTRILRARGQYVTAVDPAALDPRVLADSGVRHKRMTAEAYLASDPDYFDVIVNDMRMDARDSARLMARFARQLRPQGFALMTLKLPERQRRAIIDAAFDILRSAYTIAGARQLFHNRSEITAFLKP